MRGTDYLRGYILESNLPEIKIDPFAPSVPPLGHKSHQNHLNVRPESWRILETICELKQESIDEYVTSWIDKYIPEQSLGIEDEDPTTGERLTIPCLPVFDIPPFWYRFVMDITGIHLWLDNLPLMTVQRVLHILYPKETKDWRFSLDNTRERDEDIFRYFLWTDHTKKPSDPEVDGRSLILAFQPPWILSAQDLKEFSECNSFPPFHVPGHAFSPDLEGKDRLWAKMWDICVRKKCSWFILTSYTGWVFGGFSRGYSTGFITPVYPFDLKSPTILECLIFWIVCAMRLPASLRMPKVSEPVDNLGSISIPPPRRDTIPSPMLSESNWEGKNAEAGSSAGVDDDLSIRMSEAGLPGPPLPLYAPRPRQFVETWTATVNRVVSPPHTPREFSRSSTPVDRSRSTTPTILNFTQSGLHRGEWLVVS